MIFEVDGLRWKQSYVVAYRYSGYATMLTIVPRSEKCPILQTFKRLVSPIALALQLWTGFR